MTSFLPSCSLACKPASLYDHWLVSPMRPMPVDQSCAPHPPRHRRGAQTASKRTGCGRDLEELRLVDRGPEVDVGFDALDDAQQLHHNRSSSSAPPIPPTA